MRYGVVRLIMSTRILAEEIMRTPRFRVTIFLVGWNLEEISAESSLLGGHDCSHASVEVELMVFQRSQSYSYRRWGREVERGHEQ